MIWQVITATLMIRLLLQMVNIEQICIYDFSLLISQMKIIVLGNLITSKGPATAYAFGLAIVEKLVDKETAQKVADGLLYKDYK